MALTILATIRTHSGESPLRSVSSESRAARIASGAASVAYDLKSWSGVTFRTFASVSMVSGDPNLIPRST